MKRLKNLKMLILSMAITGILGFNSVSAMNGDGDGVPIQQNNNINIVDQNLLGQHYELWSQMMKLIIEVLEDDTNKDKVNKYRQDLQQIIARNFANDDQRAQADVEGREKLLSAIKIKAEEMVQKILLFFTEKIPNLNIDNSQKQKLQDRAQNDFDLISEMLDCTIDDTYTKGKPGQLLFDLLLTRIVKYDELMDDLKIIINNNLPQNNNNNNNDIDREYRTILDDLKDNDNNMSDTNVKRSIIYWKKYIREIADSMANEDSRKSVMSNLKDLEVIENYNTGDYNKVKAKKVELGIGQLCIAMKKKINEMITELVDDNNVGRNVMDMIIPNNINENERKKLGTERNDLIQTIKQLVNNLNDLKKNAKASYILKNQSSYTGGSSVIGDEFYIYFKYYFEQYNRLMVDAQNFLNKVAQLQNNNNQ